MRVLDASIPKKQHYLLSGGMFAACLFTLFLLPIIAVYAPFVPFRDLLFFFPQMAFPFDALVTRDAQQSHTVFSSRAAILLGIIEWSTVTLIFAWMTRRVRPRYVIPLAAATILVVVILMRAALSCFGLNVELDGP